MAIFRIEKTENYMVMSNHHLRNSTLSLKAKGLLSQILSLPENWDYTLSGLSRINRESVDTIRTAVQELERAGYVTRSRERKENGHYGNMEYLIRELPTDGDSTPPISTEPTLNKPISQNPTQANSTLGNTTQLNKDKAITEKSNTDLLSTESNPIPPQTPKQHKQDRNGTETVKKNVFDIHREIIHENIEYEHLLENNKHDHDRINEIVELMVETICTSRSKIRIASDDYPAEIVMFKFLKLNRFHIEYVLDCLRNNMTEIRNIKKYLLAVLFNASGAISPNYQTAHPIALCTTKKLTG